MIRNCWKLPLTNWNKRSVVIDGYKPVLFYSIRIPFLSSYLIEFVIFKTEIVRMKNILRCRVNLLHHLTVCHCLIQNSTNFMEFVMRSGEKKKCVFRSESWRVFSWLTKTNQFYYWLVLLITIRSFEYLLFSHLFMFSVLERSLVKKLIFPLGR